MKRGKLEENREHGQAGKSKVSTSLYKNMRVKTLHSKGLIAKNELTRPSQPKRRIKSRCAMTEKESIFKNKSQEKV